MSGTFKHNGVLMPGVDFDDGNFYLVTADGDRVWLDSNFEGLPDNTEQIYQKHVIGGTYDVYWELESLGATVPFNPRAKIVSDADISGGTFNIDMISHSLSGDFTLNGLAFPASAQQTARIILRDSENGLNNVLGLTHNGSYSQRVLAGNYDIVYQKEQGLNVPQNLDATLGQVAVDANKTHDIDVVAAQFSAPVYHNGVLFPAAQSPSARIFVFDKARKDWAYVGNTSSQTVSALLISNTYDVYYNHLAGDEIPQNVLALIHEDLVIDPPADPPAGGGFQLQVDSVLINGQMLRNDVATPASEYDDGELSFIHGADSVPLANTHDQNYSVRLINRPEPTLYFVHYSVETPGEFMPINESAYVTCVVLDPIEF